jgi:hypothetical protein
MVRDDLRDNADKSPALIDKIGGIVWPTTSGIGAKQCFKSRP